MEVYLKRDGITSVGATILANVLYKNKCLQKSYPHSNCISDLVTQAFLTNNMTLKGLNLSSNSITNYYLTQVSKRVFLQKARSLDDDRL
jgi:hypothetical protein